MKFQLADPIKKKVWDGRFLKLPLAGTIIMNKETAISAVPWELY